MASTHRNVLWRSINRIYHPFTFCCSQHPPTRPREVFLFIFLHSFPVDFFSVFSSFPAISPSLIRGRHINLQHYTTVLVFSVASLSRFLLLRLATTHNINLRNNSHIFSLPPDRKKTKQRKEEKIPRRTVPACRLYIQTHSLPWRALHWNKHSCCNHTQ